MGLTDDEFWAMSPRMYLALVEQDQIIERRHDYRAGVVAMLIANAHRDTDLRPDGWQPADFFPSLPRATEEEQDEETQIAVLDFFAAILAPK